MTSSTEYAVVVFVETGKTKNIGDSHVRQVNPSLIATSFAPRRDGSWIIIVISKAAAEYDFV